MINQFILATLNAHKVKEIQAMCANTYQVEIKSATNYVNSLPPEDGDTFKENAAIKANFVGKLSKLPTLADDSGLCIDALNDAPGIYSARWAGEDKDYQMAIKKIFQQIPKGAPLTAKFVCVLALYLPNQPMQYFAAETKGTLVYPPRGSYGFAYDVIFIPEGYNQTFAEMLPQQKNMLSHRYKAFNLFAQQCLQPR